MRYHSDVRRCYLRETVRKLSPQIRALERFFCVLAFGFGTEIRSGTRLVADKIFLLAPWKSRQYTSPPRDVLLNDLLGKTLRRQL